MLFRSDELHPSAARIEAVNTIVNTDGRLVGYNTDYVARKRFHIDANGNVIMEKDRVKRTSQISDEIRVVKGGSWKDTAYWLDPGQRRFRKETKGYGWIGFRVAQDAKNSDKPRTKR